MDINWLTESIENPNVLLQSKTELKELQSRFPYFSSLHTFNAKVEQLEGGLDYQQKIKKAAIYSPNRSSLYDYVIKPNVENAINSQLKEAQPVQNLRDKSSVKEQEQKPKLKVVPEAPLSQREKEEKIVLEKEILNHAISSSILKESDEKVLLEDKITEKVDDSPKKISAIKKTELDNSMNVLAWLNASSENKKDMWSNRKDAVDQVDKNQLLENFINQGEEKIHIAKDEAPTLLHISRPQTEFFSPENMAKMSLAENEDFVTETLAKIYAEQGNIKKAISAYKKLSLKFPEKSNYFARLIQELKEN